MTANKYLFLLLISIVFCLLSAIGCTPKPEKPVSEYGKIVEKMPDLPETKEKYEYPIEITPPRF